MIGQMAIVERIQSTHYLNSRRSQRVVLHLPVVIKVQSEDGSPCIETSRTLVVSAHGALILSTMKVQAKQTLILRNPATNEEQQCQVVSLSVRKSNNISEVGIEFTESAPHFWNISFPPAGNPSFK